MGALDVTYDPEADAAYVGFSRADASRQARLDDARIIDYADDGSIVGVEILSPSRGIDLDGIPRGREVADALTALGFVVRSGQPG